MIELLSGFFIIDKPFGWSSNRCLTMIKRVLRSAPAKTRVGYIGTLDEGATGILIVALGRATKFIRFLEESKKQYRTKLLFGYHSDTNDIHGKLKAYQRVVGDEKGDVSEKFPTLGQIFSQLPSFTGVYEQMPPIYSAKRINGQRSYQLARSGAQNIALKTKRVSLDRVEIVGIKLSSGRYIKREATDQDSFQHIFLEERVSEVEFLLSGCSTGFYVRSFARDLGEALDVGALTLEIRRTRLEFNICFETCKAISAKLNNYINCVDAIEGPEVVENREFAYNFEVPDNIKSNELFDSLSSGLRLEVNVEDSFVGIREFDYQELILNLVKIDDFFC